MANQNRRGERQGISLGFIFSLLLIIGLVAGMASIIFNNMNPSTTLTINDFVEILENNRVYSLVQTNYENTLFTLKGTYYSNATTQNRKGYTFTINEHDYNYTFETFEYHKDGDPLQTKTKLENYCISDSVTQKKVSGLIKEAKDNNPYEVSWWDQWGPTLIMTLVSILIVVFLFSRLAGSVGASNNKALEFNKSRARRENNSKIRFSDVAGADEEKVEMRELVDYLKEPQKFSAYGAKLPKGVLLVGPPGCGKTLLAKAVAGEAGVPFYSISGSDFVEMFVGVGAGRVRDMFRTAKASAPCLIFIDEIDAVGRQRGAGMGGGNDEREQTLNQLLVEMDGFSDNSGIIVIAATNRDDVLDPALMRAGRFDRKITVSLPDRKGRVEIFKVHSRNKNIDPSVDFDQLSKRTVGFSGADIANIMNEAAILAVRRNKNVVGIDEIDEAIDRRIAGPAKSSRSLTEHERDIVSHHEAGHAIIGLKYPHSDKVQKITIVPRGNTGGHVRMTPEEDRFLLTKRELEARIVGYLGGRSSEEVFFDDISTGAQNDIEMATQIARMMVTELGMSSLGPIQYEKDTGSVFLGRDYTSSQKNFSLGTAEQIDAEIRKIIDNAHDTALKIIKDNKDAVKLIAATLKEHESITAEEIDYLLQNGHLKRDEIEKATIDSLTNESKFDVNPEDVNNQPVVKRKAPARKASPSTKTKTKSDKDEK